MPSPFGKTLALTQQFPTLSPTNYDQPAIIVRAGHDPANPHHGTFTIGNWTVKCAVGRAGLVDANLKREGDGCTPIGRFPLRYGFFDPEILGGEALDFAFPFKVKPDNYYWSEEPESPVYNQFLLMREAVEDAPHHAHLFDLFVPIGWNDATPRAHGGSAIFLHAARPDFSGTAGCVVVAHDQLLDMARRLQPGMMIDIARVDAGIQPRPAKHATEPPVFETISFEALAPGPRVLITGAVHGNEPCGPKAITRAIAAFRSGQRRVVRGSVTFVPVVNGLAYLKNAREGDRNLNRNLHEKPVPASNEDRVANLLCPLLRRHDVLIDLHSFLEGERPFALIGPPDNVDELEPFAHGDAEMALVAALGLEVVVHGWMRTHRKALEAKLDTTSLADDARMYSVGTTEYMRFSGGYGVTVECGQHDDPRSVDVAYRTIFNGLAHLGVTEDPYPELKEFRLLEIRDELTAVHEQDRMAKFYDTGDVFSRGEVIGHRYNGAEIVAPYDGAMIFAGMDAEAGTALCYLCRASERSTVKALKAGE